MNEYGVNKLPRKDVNQDAKNNFAPLLLGVLA